MNTPSTGKVVIAALLGSAAAVLLRALGALLLNDSFTTEQVVHLFTASWVLLRFYAWTVGFFVIAGVPIIRWAYRTGRANLASFGIAGLLAGYASSYPLLMIPSWAALHAASGFAGALTAFLALSVLGRSESTSSSAP